MAEADVLGKLEELALRPEDDSVMKKLIGAQTSFGWSAEMLATKLEVFMCNDKTTATNSGVLGNGVVEAFVQQMTRNAKKDHNRRGGRASKQQKYNKESLAKLQAVGPEFETPSKGISAKKRVHADIIPETPLNAKKGENVAPPASPSLFSPTSMSGSPDAAKTPYASRVVKSEPVRTFGDDVQARMGRYEGTHNPGHSRVKVSMDVDGIPHNLRYMHGTVDHMAGELDAITRHNADAILAKHDLGESSPLYFVSQDSVVVTGRVCCSSEGRLNESSVDLTNLPSYSLFPGQIVALKGFNRNKVFDAHELFRAAPLPLPKTPIQQLLKYQDDSQYLGGDAMTIVVAAGPFTLSKDLEYKPLDDLLSYVSRVAPDVVVLVGPFVDADQEVIKGNVTDDACDDIFDRVYALIRKRLSSAAPQVILIPSVRDAAHHHVYPQPPFMSAEKANETAKGETKSEAGFQMHCAPNPAAFHLNELMVMATSVDVLTHFTGEEISKNCTGEGGRLERLVRHLLDQRTMYPLFPPPKDAALPLDRTRLTDLHFGEHAPDILIIPSRSRPFAFIAHGTLCINPGFLVKQGCAAGTYATVTVNPRQFTEEEMELDGEDPAVPHLVGKRTHVDIKGI